MTRDDLDALRHVARDAWLELGGCPECRGLGDLLGCPIATCTPKTRALLGIDPSLQQLPPPSPYLFVDRERWPLPDRRPDHHGTGLAEISGFGLAGQDALRRLLSWIKQRDPRRR